MFLFDAYGNPVRDMQEEVYLAVKMFVEGIEYSVVPKGSMESDGEHHTNLTRAEVTLSYSGEKKSFLLAEDAGLFVREDVPDRFKPLVAVHEYGHRRDLNHREIFLLELAAADELARLTNDPDLKTDYLKWSCNNDSFQMVRGNLGREKEQELDDYKFLKFRKIAKRAGLSGAVRKEGNKLIEL